MIGFSCICQMWCLIRSASKSLVAFCFFSGQSSYTRSYLKICERKIFQGWQDYRNVPVVCRSPIGFGNTNWQNQPRLNSYYSKTAKCWSQSGLFQPLGFAKFTVMLRELQVQIWKWKDSRIQLPINNTAPELQPCGFYIYTTCTLFTILCPGNHLVQSATDQTWSRI